MPNRIPELTSTTQQSIRTWFVEMYRRGLFFNPEDRPEDIVRIDTGAALFSRQESSELMSIIDRMYSAQGDTVVEVAWDVVRKRVFTATERRDQDLMYG